MITIVSPLVVFIIIVIPFSHTLLGFDCGGQRLNITTISLLGAGECDLKIKTPTKEEIYIQLLQLSEYNYAEVMQCKVEVHRIVYYCGMHSHISVVRNGEAEFMEETMYDRCKEMHRSGTINLGFGEDSKLKGLKINQTTTGSITIAGSIKDNGECKGVRYQDPYGNWEDVVVQGSARISLRTSYATVHLNTVTSQI